MKSKILFLWLIFSILPFLAATAKTPKILILGDSLTEGYGVSPSEAYPFLVQKLYQNQVQIINAGSSGATTSSGLSRLKWHLQQKPDFVILALGSNDGLRGTPISETKKNLQIMIDTLKNRKIQVSLIQLQLPPNYGKSYTQEFESLFKNLAQKNKIPLFPFLLKNIAGIPKLNQEDGLHPNAQGHKIIAAQFKRQLDSLVFKKYPLNTLK